MRKVFPIVLAAALVALPITTLHSAPWGWLVQKTSGSAAYQSAQLRMTPLRKGVILNKGTTVSTGTNGKVLLVRDAESVFIGPHSIATIAPHPTPGMRTTVLLRKGKLDLSVNTKARPHFSVETPYLVAIVKGTKFQVTSSPYRSEVMVREGRVRVKALISGKYADVDPGQKAMVDRSGNLTLSGKGKLASTRRGVRHSVAASLQNGGAPATGASAQAKAGTGASAQASANVGSSSVGASVGASASSSSSGTGTGSGVKSGGIGISAGAQIGGASIGVGASIGRGGIGVGGRVGLGGLGLGGGLNLGRR